MDKTSLGDRMKAYENIERRYLPRRFCTIIRIDGKAFHSYTKGFARPYDESFLRCMQMTAQSLCENIMGAKLAYHQSDEISILLTDDDTMETQPWFGKNLQKMVSIAAAMATLYFSKHTATAVKEGWASEGLKKAYEAERVAVFDARAFTLPHEEVLNYFEWRQQDCTRNAIQSAGQFNFSQKELHGKSCNEIQEMLYSRKAINFNDYPTFFKRGTCIVRKPMKVTMDNGETIERMKWTVDKEVPIFHTQPEYIEQYVYHKENTND